MKEIVLKQTSDYSLFEMHGMNRMIVSASGFEPRKDLLASMKKHGFRMSQPIRCEMQASGKMRIFDGHNRFLTARHLGIPVWFLCFPEGGGITPIEEGEGGKPWGLRDIAAAHAHDHPDYAEVFAYCEVTGIPLRAAFSMFYGQSASSGNADKFVKSGDFQIKDRNYPWKVAAVVRAAAQYLQVASRIQFVSAVSKCMFAEGFSHERLIERINKRPELLRKCGYERDYIALFEEIYNHSVKGDRLYLVAETEKAMRARGLHIPLSAKA